MAMQKELSLTEYEVTANTFNQDGVFSLALLSELAGTQEIVLPEGIRLTVLSADAAQRKFDLSELQKSLVSEIETHGLQHQVARKMDKNTEYTVISTPELSNYTHERPRSIYLYLIRDAEGNELLLIVEGLVMGNAGMLHSDLNLTTLNQALMRQVTLQENDLMRSGHIWGPLIKIDAIEDTLALHAGVSGFHEKLVRVLLRHGFVPLSSEGQPVTKR